MAQSQHFIFYAPKSVTQAWLTLPPASICPCFYFGTSHCLKYRLSASLDGSLAYFKHRSWELKFAAVANLILLDLHYQIKALSTDLY